MTSRNQSEIFELFVPILCEGNMDIHAFRSGGGLRVVRLSKADKLYGYGEHPHFLTALKHCLEDSLVGGRAYKEAYGKIYTRYLTGSQTPDNALDWLIQSGYGLDIIGTASGQVILTSTWSQYIDAPQEVKDRALIEGKQTEWEAYGRRFLSSPCRFPNGEVGYSTKFLSGPPDVVNPYQYDRKIEFEIRANTMYELLTKAEQGLRTEFCPRETFNDLQFE